MGNSSITLAWDSMTLAELELVTEPVRRFSSTVSSANTRRPSMTWAIPARTMRDASASWTFSPSKTIDPLVISPSWMSSSPVMARNVVVFPAPLAPRSATICPSRTSRDSPRSTRTTSL